MVISRTTTMSTTTWIGPHQGSTVTTTGVTTTISTGTGVETIQIMTIGIICTHLHEILVVYIKLHHFSEGHKVRGGEKTIEEEVSRQTTSGETKDEMTHHYHGANSQSASPPS